MQNTKTLPLLILLSLSLLASCTKQETNISQIEPEIPLADVSPETPPSSNGESTPQETMSANTQKNITKSTSYRTDHGKHMVTATFDITLGSENTIERVRATMNRGDHESAEYIMRFNNAAKSKLIGKKISEISYSAVGGASDTTSAFLEVASNL